MSTNQSVFGIYLTRSDVKAAVSVLKDSGFSDTDISVLLKDDADKQLVTENNTKAPAGAAVGAGSGAAVGCAIGWLAGVGALMLPGIGPVIAAGPILAALVGIGVGGALGGFAGTLIGVGISENEVNRYEGRLLTGGILVAVHCQTADDSTRAKEIMERTKGEDVSSSDGTTTERAPMISAA